MQKNKACFRSALLAAVFLCAAAFAQEERAGQSSAIIVQKSKAPQINSLNVRDKDFMLKQFDDEVEQNKRFFISGNDVFPSFYAYTVNNDDDLFNLAARFCIRYDTFCLINGITGAEEHIKGKTLLLPSADGIFVPLEESKNLSSLEFLLQKNRLALLEDTRHLRYNIDGKDFAFFPGEKFTTTERAFFLDTSMQLPVKNYRISSRYGQRANPFNGAKTQFHRGVDMAVPEGSNVFACKSGTVKGRGESSVYGKWLQIDHGRGMTSFYAHLSSIQESAKKGAVVRAGELIAKSGSTGQVTGPHLHFEIWLNGKSVDPAAYGNF
ncbi:MAG: M23 family metallopeptidase [Treponema sp.]|nr:M23 family metallopeptidase [Treponema sp.]MEE3434777.1 M23 family metallopeptidase [Treponema sp.]